MSKKIEILKEILGSSSQSGEEFLFYCKICSHHKKKLSINIEKNCAKCWVCDFSVRNLKRLVYRFGNSDQRSRWDSVDNNFEIENFDSIFENKVIEEEIVTLPNEFISFTDSSKKYSLIEPRNYLFSRGIEKRDFYKWKLGYCIEGVYKNRIIVPSFDDNGNLNFFSARSYTESFPKYKNPEISKDIIFNSMMINWNKDLVLVEGVFDAFKAENSIPILGSTLREDSKLFQKLVFCEQKIYIALDPDAEKKTQKIINSLLMYDIDIYKINIEQNKDVGEMTKEEFENLKKQAVKLDNVSSFETQILNLKF